MHLKEIKVYTKTFVMQHLSVRNDAFSGKVLGVPILLSMTVYIAI